MTRFVATGALLLATAVYVQLHPPSNLAVGRGWLAACPATFGPWNGTDLSFENAVIDELKADDLLVRRYRRGDDVTWLCVVYHRHRRYGAHDPRLCYESQGYLLEDRGVGRVGGGPAALEANRFVASRGRDRRLVYYWWSTGGYATADGAEFRRRMALEGALDNRSWGTQVRVETPVGGEGETTAAARLDDFATRVAGGLSIAFAAAVAVERR